MISEALQDVLSRALGTLRAANLPHVVIGGGAVNVWERIRSTKDLDLLVLLPTERRGEIRDALRSAGFSHQERINHTDLPDAHVFRFWYPVGDTGLSLKLDLVHGKLPLHADVLKRRVEVTAFGLTIPVCSREDAILRRGPRRAPEAVQRRRPADRGGRRVRALPRWPDAPRRRLGFLRRGASRARRRIGASSRHRRSLALHLRRVRFRSPSPSSRSSSRRGAWRSAAENRSQ